MLRPLTAAALVAALSLAAALPASAATAASAPAAKKPQGKKIYPVRPHDDEPVSGTNDNLNPGQLTAADRVLTGVADCEFKQKVSIEKIEGHSGNFKLVFDHKTYIMVPEETTTGAIRLVDTGGAVVWVQIPKKSMLMNQKEHHRLVDNCQEDEQRIAEQAAGQAAAYAPVLAPSVAGANPATAAAATATSTAPAAPSMKPAATTAAQAPAAHVPNAMATGATTAATVAVVPPAPVERAAQAPDAAASGMWK